MPGGIDVPLNEVPTESTLCPHRPFEIHRLIRDKTPERRHASGLGPDVGREPRLVAGGGGQADTVDSDALPHAHFGRERRANPEAVARGNVRISEPSADGGVRKGYGREAVYDPTAAVARLQGAPARVVDEAGNETSGPELTYRLNDDRLLVQGREDDRAYSLRRRKQP